MTAEIDVFGILADQIPGVISTRHNNHLIPSGDSRTLLNTTTASRLLASSRRLGNATHEEWRTDVAF
jgi:hypothetical protein